LTGSRTPVQRAGAGPILGADTRTALLEAGYADDEVDTLVAAGTAREAGQQTVQAEEVR